MPTAVKSSKELRPGNFFEDCAFHPCLCVRSEMGMVDGISLVDGSFPRNCGVPQCGVRKLTFEEAVRLKLFGPPDVPPELEMTDAQKYWLRNSEFAREVWPPTPDGEI
jgi:hypothetical protein